MNTLRTKRYIKESAIVAATLLLSATPSLGVVNLAAVQGNWISATETVPMWGFQTDTGSCPTGPVTWMVGPEITADQLDGDDLVISLRNCLPEATSIIIPGQQAQYSDPVRSGARITAFAKEAPADNGATTTEYRWLNVRSNPGSYLYQSGSHPALQVPMGLYGALKVGAFTGTAGDLTLLYSEIDPVLHGAPATPGGMPGTPVQATALTYKPRYFLVNGAESATFNDIDPSLPTVLSFLNAGLEFHVPTFLNSYMDVQGEDGNPYPFAKNQYSINLAAGKTMDAFWQPEANSSYTLFDRHGNNMIVAINTGAAGTANPVTVNDSYSVAAGSSLVSPAAGIPNILDNDTTLGGGAVWLAGPASGTLTCQAGGTLCADGSFTYTPDVGFSGTDYFTYQISPGSNIGYVTIRVAAANRPPVAVADSYEAVVGVDLNVAAPGVLANDSDPDGDVLTVSASSPVAISSTGAFTVRYDVAGTETISYTVCDDASSPLCSNAVVTVNVSAPAGDTEPPVAVDDSDTATRNSSVTFNLLTNDTDNVAIDPATVSLGAPTRRGSVVYNGGGSITYTPRRNWLGTDTFTYTVEDTSGNVSNTATVRVNVVR